MLSVTHHPFIVGMDYAFQTPELAIMCLELVTGGDLQVREHVLRFCDMKQSWSAWYGRAIQDGIILVGVWYGAIGSPHP